MSKKGCPVCGEVYGGGHWSVSDCPKLSAVAEEFRGSPVEEGRSFVIVPKELKEKVTEVLGDSGIDVIPSVLIKDALPKNRAWEARNADRYREYRKLYMREYRKKKERKAG